MTPKFASAICIAGAFAGTAAVAELSCALYYSPIIAAVLASARVASVFFWLADVGGALPVLFKIGGANGRSRREGDLQSMRPDRLLSVSKADLRLIAIECRRCADSSHSSGRKQPNEFDPLRTFVVTDRAGNPFGEATHS